MAILVVDEDPLRRRLLCNMLVPLARPVYQASSVEAAFDAVEAAYFDILVINTNQPQPDLYATVKLLRFSQLGDRRLPVVVLTSSRDEQTKHRCAEAGIDLCLVKPIQPPCVTRAVRKLMRSNFRRGNRSAGC
jgi:two-component system sensor histidine kinase RpfC